MAKSSSLSCIEHHFTDLVDHRTGNRKQHNLLEIIGLTIIATLCGADTFVSVEEFGIARLKWLRKFMVLKNGIPSHDTIGRCFAMMDPAQVEQGFLSWVKSLSNSMTGEIIALDGKCLRGSYDTSTNKFPIHMVSAWAVHQGLCLGQFKVDEKSNEITAIPKLLEMLDLEGCTVTIDAMGTQKEIASQIVDAGADYVLALKGNHPELYGEVTKTFEHLGGSSQHPFTQQLDAGHGRIETRRCCVLDVTDPTFDWILPEDLQPWKGLSSVIMVEAQRMTPKGTSLERRYYISSLRLKDCSSEKMNQIIRSHWAIENSLHWSLDVTFKEDQSRIRTEAADQNLSIIRRLVLNILKKDKSTKLGLQNKRLKAGWDEKYLLKILEGEKS